MKTKPITVAVITGGHAYDVVNFHELFRSLEGINGYIQHLDDFGASSDVVRDRYDVLVFFIMMMEGPFDEDQPGYRGRPKRALERIGESEQGIVVLHHGILAYPQWPVWDEVVGMSERQLAGYQHDESLRVKAADRTHPITKGLSDWTMVDETYDMVDASPDNQVLLTVDHANSMKTVAWTHSYRAGKVFCLQSGHDQQTWEDDNFRKVLRRGIAWSCGCLETSAV